MGGLPRGPRRGGGRGWLSGWTCPHATASASRLLRTHAPGVEVWAYGSRVNGESHAGSDLDLALRGPRLERLPDAALSALREALTDSDVPILVQAHDWAALPESFRREIERDHVVLAKG